LRNSVSESRWFSSRAMDHSLFLIISSLCSMLIFLCDFIAIRSCQYEEINDQLASRISLICLAMRSNS
jgi:hypothetical protein